MFNVASFKLSYLERHDGRTGGDCYRGGVSLRLIDKRSVSQMDKWSFGQGPKKRAPISKMRKGQKQHKKFLLYK